MNADKTILVLGGDQRVYHMIKEIWKLSRKSPTEFFSWKEKGELEFYCYGCEWTEEGKTYVKAGARDSDHAEIIYGRSDNGEMIHNCSDFGETIYNCSDFGETIHNCSDFGEILCRCGALVLPIPYTLDGKMLHQTKSENLVALPLEQLWNMVQAWQLVMGYQLREEDEKVLSQKGARVLDLRKSPEYQRAIAEATAAGVFEEARKLSSSASIWGKVLVLGYGACGKRIAKRFAEEGARVYVMARSEEQRNEAKRLGLTAAPLWQKGWMQIPYDVVINTIPAPVLTKQRLQNVAEHTIILDIASGKGGTDFAYCESVGIRAKLCPGLPGKYAPKMIGKTMATSFWTAYTN